MRAYSYHIQVGAKKGPGYVCDLPLSEIQKALILSSASQRHTVAHNCHGKRNNLKAKRNNLMAKVKESQQKK